MTSRSMLERTERTLLFYPVVVLFMLLLSTSHSFASSGATEELAPDPSKIRVHVLSPQGSGDKGPSSAYREALPEDYDYLLDEEDVRTIQIIDQEVPLTASFTKGPVWALANLALSMAGVALSAILLLYSLKGRIMGNSIGGDAIGANRSDEGIQQRARNHTICIVTAIALGITGDIAFTLTQDMTKAMVFLDAWTILFLGIFMAQILACIFARRDTKYLERYSIEKDTFRNF